MKLTPVSKFWLSAVGAGFGAALALIGAVFATGQTFGQRCGKVYHAAAAREQCVSRLSKGGEVVPTISVAEAR